jgi:hypothetical protein
VSDRDAHLLGWLRAVDRSRLARRPLARTLAAGMSVLLVSLGSDAFTQEQDASPQDLSRQDLSRQDLSCQDMSRVACREPEPVVSALQDLRSDSKSPTEFYITVDGQTPKPSNMISGVPDIVVKQRDVEDWIIENRTAELHDFNIHQLQVGRLVRRSRQRAVSAKYSRYGQRHLFQRPHTGISERATTHGLSQSRTSSAALSITAKSWSTGTAA